VKLWIDAQLPPSLARAQPGSRGASLPSDRPGLAGCRDEAIYAAARAAADIVVTKDSDFVRLLERHGPPPKVLWIALGNVSNRELTRILSVRWEKIRAHFESGEPLVELGRSAD
jgi:predicted nuclease of predicted toxin-antitoxin system